MALSRGVFGAMYISMSDIGEQEMPSKKLMSTNLMNYSLYVTLEPCIICCYVISKFKIGSLYFGSYDTKHGSVQNGDKFFVNAKNSYKPKVYGGIGEKQCSALLQSFFRKLRKSL